MSENLKKVVVDMTYNVYDKKGVVRDDKGLIKAFHFLWECEVEYRIQAINQLWAVCRKELNDKYGEYESSKGGWIYYSFLVTGDDDANFWNV